MCTITAATATARIAFGILIAVAIPSVGQPLAQRRDSAYDGRNLIRVTDKTATVWNAKDGSVLHRLTSHGEAVTNVQISPDGSLVLTSSYLPPNELNIRSKDDSIRLWCLSTGKQLLCIDNATHGQFSLDGKRIYGFVKRAGAKPNSGNSDIAAWEVKTGKKLFTAVTPGDGANPGGNITLAESSHSPKLLFFQYGQPMVYDSSNGRAVMAPLSQFLGGENGFITPNGDDIQLAEFRYVSYYSVSSGKELKRVPYPVEDAWNVGWRQDGQGFAAVSASGLVMSYDRKTEKSVSAPGGVDVPQSVIVSPSGNRFIVNWGGANAIPEKATGFNPKDCKSAWDCRGQVVGFTGSDEAVVVDGPQVSIINVSSGQFVRGFKLK